MITLKYPIFFIHGTGFRDRKRFGYWGRIPAVLEEQGIRIGYGNQDSWGTIEDNAKTIKRNLIKFMEETGCEKVNIIAHSKGAIEARYLAAALDCPSYIASITSICGPHHGSKTMDKLQKMPSFLFLFAALFVNLWFRILGDEKPDFKNACKQFTTDYMCAFNQKYPDVDSIYYQSYATMMKHPFSDIFMTLPNLIVRLVEGENDGLVTVASARWTNFSGVWLGATARGISHADAVDFRRRRFTCKASDAGITDICDCYVDIVQKLYMAGF